MGCKFVKISHLKKKNVDERGLKAINSRQVGIIPISIIFIMNYRIYLVSFLFCVFSTALFADPQKP